MNEGLYSIELYVLDLHSLKSKIYYSFKCMKLSS